MADILTLMKTGQKEESGELTNPNLQGVIELKNVSFSYPTNKNKLVLDNISFKVDRGEKVAIIGSSGSGKSTIMQLLMGFYQPDKGQILIDGVDLRQYDLKFIRNKFGFVQQQPVLFADSIRNNLNLGVDPKIKDEELEEYLKQANAKKFVNNFKDSLGTFVGSEGG